MNTITNMTKKYSIINAVCSIGNIGAAIIVGKKVKEKTEKTAAGIAAGIGTVIGLKAIEAAFIGSMIASEVNENFDQMVDEMVDDFDTIAEAAASSDSGEVVDFGHSSITQPNPIDMDLMWSSLYKEQNEMLSDAAKAAKSAVEKAIAGDESELDALRINIDRDLLQKVRAQQKRLEQMAAGKTDEEAPL